MIRYAALSAALMAAALAGGIARGEPRLIGAESVVPINPRSLWSRYVNRRPADGELLGLNPPRISWPYNADFPEDFGDALHMFTLQIAADPDFDEPVVNVSCPFNFHNTLPALEAGRAWHWRVGYDVGTPAERWSRARSFAIAPDAAQWDRSALAEPDLAAMGHPRVLLRPEMMDRLRASAETDPGSQAALEYIRRRADGVLERPWWSDYV